MSATHETLFSPDSASPPDLAPPSPSKCFYVARIGISGHPSRTILHGRRVLDDARPIFMSTEHIVLQDGKYHLMFNQSTGEFKCNRYNEAWRSLSGDGMVLALFQALQAERTANAELRRVLAELKRNVVDVILPSARSVSLDIGQIALWDQCVKDVDAALTAPLPAPAGEKDA